MMSRSRKRERLFVGICPELKGTTATNDEIDKTPITGSKHD